MNDLHAQRDPHHGSRGFNYRPSVQERRDSASLLALWALLLFVMACVSLHGVDRLLGAL
jgi:hypothetical protein|uniref:Uncharacterized protein n=1 Tax=uncultured marine virus TaxID=186617 RepID=A0A0F7L773_9VIRU|nr:hypothetical protein [uncultured marine virus]